MSLVPYVIEQTSRGERSYDIFSRLVKGSYHLPWRGGNRRIRKSYCIPAYCSWSPRIRARTSVFTLTAPAVLYLPDLAIYDTMNYIKCDVSTICMGMAASMGAFLLAGGTKGKRFALPNATIMIHQPSGGAQGQATDIKIVADRIIETRKQLNQYSWLRIQDSLFPRSRSTQREIII